MREYIFTINNVNATFELDTTNIRHDSLLANSLDDVLRGSNYSSYLVLDTDYSTDAIIWEYLNSNCSDEENTNILINNVPVKVFRIYDTASDGNILFIADINTTLARIQDDKFVVVEGDLVYQENANGDYDIGRCEHCDNYFWTDNLVLTYDEVWLCNNCLEENGFLCEGCDNTFSDRSVAHVNSDGDYFCEDCWGDIEDEEEMQTGSHEVNNSNVSSLEVVGAIDDMDTSSSINGYHCYNRSFDFKKLDGETTKEYMGVELEIENPRADSSMLYKASNFVRSNFNCVTASDSSLNNGFEVISDPQTLNYWLSRKSKIDKVFKELIDHGFISHDSDNCGLHIHISRDSLGETQEEQNLVIARLELIIENFKDEIKMFSRRSNYHYCEFLSNIVSLELSTDDILKKKERQTGRYQVINLNNRNTIEFRVFKGTLITDTFFAALQLVHNLIELAKSDDYKGKTWNYLIKMNNYEELIKYNGARTIHTLKRIKDYTEEIKAKKIILDKKMMAWAKIQQKTIDDFSTWQLANYQIIEMCERIVRGDMFQKLRHYDDDFIGYIETMRAVLNKISDYTRVLQENYTTADGVNLRTYDKKKLLFAIGEVKKSVEEVKKYLKDVI